MEHPNQSNVSKGNTVGAGLGAIAVCLVISLLAGPSLADGTIVSLEGRVYGHTKGSKTALSVGEKIGRGKSVSTGEASKVEIEMDDGSMLRLSSNTRITLSPRSRPRRRSVMLMVGRLWNRITRLTSGDVDAESYKVVTVNAVAGVRGTDFTAAVGADGSVRVQVTDGGVEVRKGGRQVQVGAGEQVETLGGSIGETQPATDDWTGFSADAEARLNTGAGEIASDTVRTAREQRQAARNLVKEHGELTALRDEKLASESATSPQGAREIQDLNEKIAAAETQISEIADLTQAGAGYLGALNETVQNDPSISGASQVAAKVEEAQQIADEVRKASDAILPKPSESGGTGDATAESPKEEVELNGDGLMGKIESAVSGISSLAGQAQSAGDQVKVSCINSKLSGAKGLQQIGRQAKKSLDAAVTSRDPQAADDAYARLSVAAQKAEQLLGAAQACAGGADVYDGETETEVELSEEAQELENQDPADAAPSVAPPAPDNPPPLPPDLVEPVEPVSPSGP